MRRVQCLYGCSTTLHHASTDHAWERPVRDTAVGWTTRARRTPHTGRGQPWAARGGFREAVRARQGLARVASVGRISVQVGLTLLPMEKSMSLRPSQTPFRACGTPGTRWDGRHECRLQLSQSNISRCLSKFRSVTPPTWRSGSNAKLHVRFQKHGRDTFRPGYEFGTRSRWLRASALGRYRSLTCERSPFSTFFFTTSGSCSRYEVSPP